MPIDFMLLNQEKKPLSYFYRIKYYFLLIPIVIAALLLIIVNVDFDITFQTTSQKDKIIDFSWNSEIHDLTYVDKTDEGYFIKTKGCTIPAFDPFDPSVTKFYEKVKPIICYNENNPPLVESDHNSIWIIEENIANYNITSRDELQCRYTPFYRQSSKEDSSDDRYKYLKESFDFKEKTYIKHEFIRVECKDTKKVIYKDFHSFVIKGNPKKAIEKASKTDKYNVLILGIDAVSRLNFHRTMPKTLKFLLDSGAVEFKGYNKVGDNTYPNLIPVLTGLSENELAESCYTGQKPRFDKCHFIWDDYSDAGFYTAFAEDAAPISLFNYMKRGFIEKPTDYYWRTFAKLAGKEIGHDKRLNANLCLGPRKYVDVLLSYAKKFTAAMLDSPSFGFFWQTSTTHDFLNFPMLCDDSYENLLETLTVDGLLDNTVVVVMSDHGIRWGAIRSTQQGRMEERLPFLYFLFPENFKESHQLAVYNMKTNTRKLTTPFDLHETLISLLNTDEITDENLHQTTIEKKYLKSRGISLFLPIHENRTCESASIDPHWCTCHQTRKLNVASPLSFNVSGVVVDHMNSLLSNLQQCAKLKVNKILDFSVEETSLEVLSEVKPSVLDYTIVLETLPGNGMFEATVTNSTIFGLKVTGAVSRINLYGNQSLCIDEFHLKLYCYCSDNVPLSE